MAEYIDRNEAIEQIDEWLDSVGTVMLGKGLSYYGELIGCIEDCKSADVAPVRHGKWNERQDGWGDSYYTCSVCGVDWATIDGTPWENGMEYCPNCGAKMDGGRRKWR